MNITKAIEILDNHQADLSITPAVDLRDAIKLGREALKFFHNNRREHTAVSLPILPGETED